MEGSWEAKKKTWRWVSTLAHLPFLSLQASLDTTVCRPGTNPLGDPHTTEAEVQAPQTGNTVRTSSAPPSAQMPTTVPGARALLCRYLLTLQLHSLAFAPSKPHSFKTPPSYHTPARKD